jgi:type II secretory pathway pseudopilin PulG
MRCGNPPHVLRRRSKGMRHSKRKAGAFVVLELVIVVIVLAILAALLFPLFARSLEQARTIPCISNCAQLGMALYMYVHDYDGVYPTLNCEAARRVRDDWGEGYGGHWAITSAARSDYFKTASIGAQLLPYTRSRPRRASKAGPDSKDRQIPLVDDWTMWACPSDGGVTRNWSPGMRWSSYHYRHFLSSGFADGYQDFPGPHAKVWHDSEIEFPAQTYVFSELWPWHDDRREDLEWLPKNERSGWSPDARIHLTFMDGHTRAARADRCILRAPWWPGQGYDYHWPRLPAMKDCGRE